ncbi:MAG: Gfo/Idh/MocA family oxidoreductase [Ruminococcaceae bacterium]|nr:Gfo/Idh/MocA family oxidoreductase [Oscillospiraceae bacterium]
MKQVKIGIFGLGRGGHYIKNFLANNAEIVAICDNNPKKVKLLADKLGKDVACFDNFDEFIEQEMDGVVIANYFHEHTKYIIRCLEKNLHVFCECTSNSTMAEGVQLVRAAEKSKAFFMLAENYPYMLFNQEMKRVYEGGTLGKLLYAEGEYNHPGDPYNTDSVRSLFDGEKHWRNFLPRTYYITHSLAPLVFATGALPVRVTAMPVVAPAPKDCARVGQVAEKAAIITCLNDDQSVFRVTGCAAFGAEGNFYRICGEKGQIENVKGTDNFINLNYNSWEVPEGKEQHNYYQAQWNDKDAELIKQAGHGGGDFCVARKFLECVKTNTPPDMDVYFATRLASVAILSHRSMLEGGVPYDIPDFRKEEDRVKYENDTLSPFWYSDGTAPTIPCTTVKDYGPTQVQREKFNKALQE